MNKAEIQRLFEYNKWANAQILKVVSLLSAEQLERDMTNSHASVRDTLVHMIGAEWIWLERWKGTSQKALPGSEEFPSLESIKARWSEIERDQMEFVNGLSEDDLPRPLSYINFR